jgi:hypothetical protein
MNIVQLSSMGDGWNQNSLSALNRRFSNCCPQGGSDGTQAGRRVEKSRAMRGARAKQPRPEAQGHVSEAAGFVDQDSEQRTVLRRRTWITGEQRRHVTLQSSAPRPRVGRAIMSRLSERRREILRQYAQEMRSFYTSLGVSSEITERAVGSATKSAERRTPNANYRPKAAGSSWSHKKAGPRDR